MIIISRTLIVLDYINGFMKTYLVRVYADSVRERVIS